MSKYGMAFFNTFMPSRIGADVEALFHKFGIRQRIYRKLMLKGNDMDIFLSLYGVAWMVAIFVGLGLLIKVIRDRINNEDDDYYDKKIKK